MGNSCCSNEAKDDATSFTISGSERRILAKNMQLMEETPEISQHAPDRSTANVCLKMNELNHVVNEILKKEKPPSFPKELLSKKYQDFVFLGPFKYKDGETYEGQYFRG